MVSLHRKLETQGYLSLNQFVKYLKEYQPQAAMSYPTALKLVAERKLRARIVGSQNRITYEEAQRWVAEGNYEHKFSGPYSTYDGDMP